MMASVREVTIIFKADTSEIERAFERVNYQARLARVRCGIKHDWHTQQIGLGVERCPVDRG